MSAYRAHRSTSLYSPPYHLSPLAFLLAAAPWPTLPITSLLARLRLYSMPRAAMAEAEAQVSLPAANTRDGRAHKHRKAAANATVGSVND